jgi:hypothetical protein
MSSSLDTSPGETRTLDLGAGVTLDLQYIPPGEFWMGSRDGSRDERMPIGSGFRLFLQRGAISVSIAHQHWPKSFPEGELLDSPGFAAQRLPWVRDIHEPA